MQADRTNEIDPAAPVTEQASGWWVLLNEGSATQADHRAFAAWVSRSPERVSAYLQAAQVSHVLRSPRTQWPDTSIDELIGAAAASGVARFPGTADGSAKPSRRPARLVPRLTIATALVAVVVAAIGLYFFYPQTERFETALGEQRSVTLSDGSLVTLNTLSAVEVRFDGKRRHVALVGGEALFQVAHDTARPFEVTAREVTVRAVGTRFNVDRHSPTTRVMVTEGRVQVSARSANVPLGVGEQLTLAPQGEPRISHVNVAAATAWTQRELVFESQPLGEIAAELNRYNRQVIDIQGEALRAEQVTGVFQSHDPASFLAFIRRVPGVSVELSADGSRYVVRQSEQR
jgi:transmembrane sensor